MNTRTKLRLLWADCVCWLLGHERAHNVRDTDGKRFCYRCLRPVSEDGKTTLKANCP